MPALRVNFTRAPLSDLSSALMKELGDKIASKHHLEGAWTRDETRCPIIAVSADSTVGSKALKTLRGRSPLVGFTQGYQTGFGHTGTLTIGIEFVQKRSVLPIGRFCAPIQPGWLELFESPQYPEVLLFRNQRPIERLKASISFKGWGFTPSEPVWVEDASAAYWATFNCSSDWDDLLTPEDRLRKGWVECLKKRCGLLLDRIKRFVETEREHLPSLLTERETPALSRLWEDLEWMRENSRGLSTLEEYISILLAEKRALDRLLNAVDEVIKLYGLLRVFLDFIEIQERHPHLSSDWFSLIRWAIYVYITLSKHTDCGLRLTYLSYDSLDNTSGILRYHDIDANSIASIIAPEEWWPRVVLWNNLSYTGNAYAHLAADAIPSDPKLVYTALEHIVIPDPQACLDTAEKLLTEAQTCQEWTIPPGAMVELQWGPFARLQFWQLHGTDTIEVIAWTNKGEFWLAGFNMGSHVWHEVYPDGSGRPDIEAAWRLLIASIVRDFMVVEQRERVWHTRQQPRPRGIRPIEDRSDKIIVYIPRVRYVNKTPENAVIMQGVNDLDLQRRSRHAVREHIRRVAGDASEAQRVLAAKYGFILPESYTFVRPHMRGGLDNRERVYRSRSALACIYHAEMIEDVGHKVEWFQFERDCKRFLERRGLTVVHVAASRSGDYGIDLYASHAATGQLYAVQCKCYNPRHPVGPAVIRELVGSLTRYPEGTIGMVITTSDLTSEAKEEAERNGVLWINGAAFAHEIQQNRLHGGA